ncbi:hypothetical protein RRG08_011234 [Elysia crispata]|uniref:Uncharacterized protein n=1 Tax=Elysia crispata TaxID=231223 RepID=A0AAE0YNN9_9GAST|nr:hypothetical protein RRG08_011234 [Elysia crispata]
MGSPLRRVFYDLHNINKSKPRLRYLENICHLIFPMTRRFLASGDVRLMAVMSCVLSIHMMTGSTGPLAFRLKLCLTGSKSCDDILIAPGAD